MRRFLGFEKALLLISITFSIHFNAQNTLTQAFTTRLFDIAFRRQYCSSDDILIVLCCAERRYVLSGLASTLTFPIFGIPSFAYETSPKPRAPIEYLVPATAVRYRVSALSDAIDASSQRSTPSAVLNRIATILYTPELVSNSKTKKFFDTYTNALQYNPNKLTMHLTKSERKAFIRENESLFTVSAAITSDLDLRDLHRNEIVTLLQDIAAEIDYLQRQKTCTSSEGTTVLECNLSDLTTMIHDLEKECNIWFSFIPEEDVQQAYNLFLGKLPIEMKTPSI